MGTEVQWYIRLGEKTHSPLIGQRYPIDIGSITMLLWVYIRNIKIIDMAGIDAKPVG
jgi:hypothetical protein